MDGKIVVHASGHEAETGYGEDERIEFARQVLRLAIGFGDDRNEAGKDLDGVRRAARGDHLGFEILVEGLRLLQRGLHGEYHLGVARGQGLEHPPTRRPGSGPVGPAVAWSSPAGL